LLLTALPYRKMPNVVASLVTSGGKVPKGICVDYSSLDVALVEVVVVVVGRMASDANRRPVDESRSTRTSSSSDHSCLLVLLCRNSTSSDDVAWVSIEPFRNDWQS
jgi:hypothetical protein